MELTHIFCFTVSKKHFVNKQLKQYKKQVKNIVKIVFHS